MGDEQKPKVENLELNKETLQDLTEQEAAAAHGGLVGKVGGAIPTDGGSCACQSNVNTCRCQ